MSFAAAAIRTAIIETVEASGPFSYGAFTGMPRDALMAKLRQTSTGQHWFDVQITPEKTSGSSTVPFGNSSYTMGLDVAITVWTGLATPAQETQRDAILDEIGSDCGDAARALARPGELYETAADEATAIVGGCLSQPPRWRLLRANWTADAAHAVHELRGRMDVRAEAPGFYPEALLGDDYVADFHAGSLVGVVSDGAAVSTWPNLASNGDAVSTGSARPVFGIDGINGRPCVTGDGVDDVMIATLSTAIPSGSRPHMWVVFQSVDAAGGKGYAHLDAATPNENYLKLGTANVPDARWHTSILSTQTSSVAASENSADTEPHVISGGLLADFSDQLKVDDMPFVGLRDPGETTVALTIVRLFADVAGSFGNVRIGRVVVSRSAPSAEIDQAMYDGLYEQWMS